MIDILRKISITREAIYRAGCKRAEKWMRRIEEYLPKNGRILDIGCGMCAMSKVMCKKHQVTSLDVKNKSFVKDIKPILYDGKRMPFEEKSFDAALVMFILHHTKHQKQVLEEAKRVSKRIIVMEDIFKSTVHKYWTYFLDSVSNLEFFGHPHSNRKDKEWQQFFAELGLKVKSVRYISSMFGWRHAIYVLE